MELIILQTGSFLTEYRKHSLQVEPIGVRLESSDKKCACWALFYSIRVEANMHFSTSVLRSFVMV